MVRPRLPLLLLVCVPMLSAALGALADEHLRLGFTTWRTACRSAGLRWDSLLDFTLQLLPLALIGLLLGGLIVLALGARRGASCGHPSLAAHAGCALSLPVTLLLCAWLPPAVMLPLDVALALLVALLVQHFTSVALRTGAASRA